MILLFTDFGLSGPYLGQVRAALHQTAPGVPVFDLFADAPQFNPRAAAHLLAAYQSSFPVGSVFLCVVDPGVGSERAALVLLADGRWFVGPDNGVMAVTAARAKSARWYRITWRPERLSASFHGRDLFAPVAARIADGERISAVSQPIDGPDVVDLPDDLFEVVYIDGYGNVMTGIRAAEFDRANRLKIGDNCISWANSFYEVPPGNAFWYENSNGLVEIAVNCGRADDQLGLGIGARIELAQDATGRQGVGSS